MTLANHGLPLRRIALAMAGILVAAMSVGCGELLSDPAVGKWQDESGRVLFLEADGTGALQESVLTWEREDAKIRIVHVGRHPRTRPPLEGFGPPAESIVEIDESDGLVLLGERFSRMPIDDVYREEVLVGFGTTSFGHPIEFTEDGFFYREGWQDGRYRITDLGYILRVKEEEHPEGPWAGIGYVRESDDGIVVHYFHAYDLITYSQDVLLEPEGTPFRQ